MFGKILAAKLDMTVKRMSMVYFAIVLKELYFQKRQIDILFFIMWGMFMGMMVIIQIRHPLRLANAHLFNINVIS